jgi:hypothetical protein
MSDLECAKINAKVECLKLAAPKVGLSPVGTVALAQEFYDWILRDESGQTQAVPQNARKRAAEKR